MWMNMVKIKAIAAPGVHDRVLALLQEELEGGRILDVGAGQGALSDRLKCLGFDVRACDINIQQFRCRDIVCDRIDLNEPLPYDDETFDAVTCIEVIEHLMNPYNLLKEIGRVVKRDGFLILSTPNIIGLHRRIRFLIHGEFGRYFPKEGFSGAGYHIYPLHPYQIEYFLHQAGFTVTETTTNMFVKKVNTYGILPFLLSLLELPFYIIAKPKDKVLLRGDILIFKCRASSKQFLENPHV